MFFWGTKNFQPVQFYPRFKRAARGIQKLPSHRQGQTKSPIVGGAAAYANNASPGPFLRRCMEHCPQAKGVQHERMKSFWRKESQADDKRRFDNGCFTFWFPPPASPQRPMCGINRFYLLDARLGKVADDFTKAIA